MDEKLIILFIIIGAVVALGLIVLVIFLVNKSRTKNKKLSQAKQDEKLIEGLGGENNIESIVSVVGSRLSVKLFDAELLKRDLLKEAGITSVIVMSNKVTLVIENRAKELSRSLEKLASSRNGNK